ncbi:hypothetical protein DM860_005091 [Cuscuta australis]|uniref:BAG domain-containing protein n=1 Tax=Cuscuta australis TaxID=267555 RepID=A0A328DMD8_9ASTE|nr:hypothetical protein DM860_005091 [Cuscuta australis]
MAADHHHYHPCFCRSSTAAVPLAPCICYSVDPACYHPPHPPAGLHSIPPCFPDPQQPHLFGPCSNSPHSSQTLLHHNHHRQTQCCPPQHFLQELHHLREAQPQPVVSSLLRRIASLESSLRRRSVSSHSLRDTAARTIQTQFRAFLVRRSKTLRHLKELASIKSALNNLKSSASSCDPQALSYKANRLLPRLDSIQGSDPMIRDGKKSISRELIKFMELIDETCVENYSHPSRIVKIVKHGSSSSSYSDSRVQMLHEMDKMESIMNKYIELRKSVEDEDEHFESPRDLVIKKSGILQTRNGGLGKRHGEAQSKANKVVTFAEDGNVRNLKPISSRESYRTVDSNGEVVDNLCRRVEDLGVAFKEVEVDDEEAQGSSDGETEPNHSSIKEGNFERKKVDHGERGSFFFSPFTHED